MQNPFFFATLFLLLSLFAVAQELDVKKTVERPEWALQKIFIDRTIRATLESDPSGMIMLFCAGMSDFQEEFGITKEQIERMQELMQAAKPINFDEIGEKVFDPMLRKVVRDANYVPNEEEEAAIAGLIKTLFDAANTTMAEAFTDEQIQKMDGMLLAVMSGLESPFFNERHMAALDMTDEQKEKFRKINEDTKPGREKMIAGIVTEIEKMLKDGKISYNGLTAVLAKFKDFSRDLKQRRSEVLTPAQIAKVRTLSKLPKSLSVFNLLLQWMPGANSWKPGDPLPEGVVKPPPQPAGSFPRTETE
jgi:Spy/CpxP family protein refolding chaperone